MEAMTDVQLIARQAKLIEEMRDELFFLKQRIKSARLHIFCIGGPLNDNALAFSPRQQVVFQNIASDLDCLGDSNE